MFMRYENNYLFQVNFALQMSFAMDMGGHVFSFV